MTAMTANRDLRSICAAAPRAGATKGRSARSSSAASILSVLISAGIVLTLIFEAISFLTSIDLEPALRPGWFPRRGMYRSPTLLVGTLIVTVIAMLIAAPIGLAARSTCPSTRSPRTRKTIKPILEILAGIPSVVLGFFALTWISPNVVETIFNTSSSFSLMAAGIGVGILTIPLVASISEDAMRAVPARCGRRPTGWAPAG